MLTVQCVTFWYGSALGPIERACLRSVLRQGHPLALYCYREPAGVPAGVQLRDAATILPESAVFHHRGGSPAPFADWFRYALQRSGAGVWIDADLYFINAVRDECDYLFGLQEPGIINNALLHLPADSLLLTQLLKIFETYGGLPWLSMREKAAAYWSRVAAPGSYLERLPWGATGPRALTALAQGLGLIERALPVTVLYPVPWQQAGWIADPQVTLEAVVSPDTVAVHLWNACIAGLKNSSPAPGSFLERLLEEGA